MPQDDKGKTDSKNDKIRHGDISRALSELSQIGIMIISCVGVGIALGWFLDNLLGTSPWLMLVCIFLGIGAAFKSIFDFARKQ